MAAAVFTDEQLRAAWHDRRRATWPATFEEAMNDPSYRQIVQIEARIKANQAAKRAARTTAPTPTRSLPQGLLPLIPSTPPVLDHKRRAAGERDDD